ncbi:MAG: M20/M25/M40 family metallo-hydrolase [Thermotogota bacterium]
MSDRMVRAFCDMVRIDSESGNEARFIDYMRGEITRRLGARCTVDDHGNLVARVPAKGNGSARPILLGAHADTVKPGVGIEPVVEDGMIRSRGDTVLGADNKAAIAEILEAVETADIRPPLEIVLTRGEEVGLVGARNLDMSLISARTGFVVDSGRLDTVTIGGPTHVAFDVTIVGRAAHAGLRPEAGISAIRVAAQAIVRMPEGRIDEETTANLGIIHGGAIRNGVPAEVRIQGECRSLDHEKCLRQADAMKRAFEDAAREAGATVEVVVSVEYEASRLAEDAPTVKMAKAAIAAVGFEPRTEISRGGSDALVLNMRGVETVLLGYGGKSAHTTDEHIAITDMVKATELLRTLLVQTAVDGE